MALASAKNIGRLMLNMHPAHIAIVNHLDKHAPHVTLSHIYNTKHSNAGLTKDTIPGSL